MLSASDTALVQPTVIHQVPPKYPEDALKVGAEGRVLLTVTLNEKGEISKIVPAQVVKKWPSFTDAATQATRQWRFTPAMKDGKPVATEIVIPFDFKLGDKKSPPKPDGD